MPLPMGTCDHLCDTLSGGHQAAESYRLLGLGQPAGGLGLQSLERPR